MPILYTVLYVVVLFICGYGIGNATGINIIFFLSFLLMIISGITYGLYILMIYPGFMVFWIFIFLTLILTLAGAFFGAKSQPTE